MSENQKEYADLIKNQLENDQTIILIEPMKMALREVLKVHVQPKGKKDKMFEAVVPLKMKGWLAGVRDLRARINLFYGEVTQCEKAIPKKK